MFGFVSSALIYVPGSIVEPQEADAQTISAPTVNQTTADSDLSSTTESSDLEQSFTSSSGSVDIFGATESSTLEQDDTTALASGNISSITESSDFAKDNANTFTPFDHLNATETSVLEQVYASTYTPSVSQHASVLTTQTSTVERLTRTTLLSTSVEETDTVSSTIQIAQTGKDTHLPQTPTTIFSQTSPSTTREAPSTRAFNLHTTTHSSTAQSSSYPSITSSAPLVSLTETRASTARSTSTESESSSIFSVRQTVVQHTTEHSYDSPDSPVTDSLETSIYVTKQMGETQQPTDLEDKKDDPKGGKSTFQENYGLFIFLIVAGVCIIGICLFGIIGSAYQQRMRTWNPRMAYEDAYADLVCI